jgi:RNA polymerase sigma-70 factor (ECF subfamily)
MSGFSFSCSHREKETRGAREPMMPSWTEDTPSSTSEGFAEESRLVVRAQGGDQTAFEALYERYNDRICRYLIRMIGNDGVGCELTQEAFLRAWEALPGLRAPARFAGWLYRIATNCAYTYQQRARHLRLVSWDVFEYGQIYHRLMREQSVSARGGRWGQ